MVIMFQGIKLVIYDLDGVLIDSNKAILESFRRTFEEIGEPFQPEMILSRIGHGLYQIFMDILPETYDDRLEELRQTYIKHFQSLDIKYTKLLDEVPETLGEIKKLGYMQALATNKTVTEAERILGELGVSEYFDLMAGFMTVSRAKPEPDMILYLLDNLEVEPDEAVFIDDTNVGLTAGIRAGVHTVGITTGNNTLEQIQSVNPDTIIHRFSDIPRLLE
ncbi:MAG: HAD family hydrolase [Candidatus Bathyarchaeota archaeon]|nr:HAD family hydrolase [Candidatus Bathyarchaeota archaeon]